MANIIQMMQKAAGAKQKIKDMRERLETLMAEGRAGETTCVMTGRFELRHLTLDPALMAGGDATQIETAILAATADAHNKISRHIADETQNILSDLGLPPGMDLPI